MNVFYVEDTLMGNSTETIRNSKTEQHWKPVKLNTSKNCVHTAREIGFEVLAQG